MTTRPGSLLHDVTEALAISMAKADAALDAGDMEAHGTWSAWSQTLLEAQQREAQQPGS